MSLDRRFPVPAGRGLSQPPTPSTVAPRVTTVTAEVTAVKTVTRKDPAYTRQENEEKAEVTESVDRIPARSPHMVSVVGHVRLGTTISLSQKFQSVRLEVAVDLPFQVPEGFSATQLTQAVEQAYTRAQELVDDKMASALPEHRKLLSAAISIANK